MAIDKKILVSGFFITLLIFAMILFLNTSLNKQREENVVGQMDNLVKEYEDMQTVFLMSEFMGENASCVVLKSMISDLNKDLWELGRKIDTYRQAREEFVKDPFYIEQKKKFNRREVLYFTVLKRVNQVCISDQAILSYFYKNKDACPDCDAQSFVLSDIKKDLEEIDKAHEIAIFSFDTDLELPTVGLLVEFYNISAYPCITIEDEIYCGLKNKNEIINIFCGERNLSLCGNPV
ncbi:MAG: hypothetical protein NTV63_02630 [Candidatus Woesearchaeota archaeon]|nr:hypothetical protein [Candidatus Woesearchaeota archaeon]